MLFTSFAVGTPLSFSSSLKQKNKIHIEIRKSIFFLSTKYMNVWYGSRDVRHRHHRHHQVHLPLPLQLINRSTININIDDYRLYYYEPALTETTATGCCWCCWCAACWAVNVACFYINRSLAIKTKNKNWNRVFFLQQQAVKQLCCSLFQVVVVVVVVQQKIEFVVVLWNRKMINFATKK